MNKGMAMVAIDELKKAREEAIKFAQETDNAIVMLIGNTLGDRDDAIKRLKGDWPDAIVNSVTNTGEVRFV